MAVFMTHSRYAPSIQFRFALREASQALNCVFDTCTFTDK